MASASPSPSPTTSSFPSSGNESSEASDDAAPLKGDGPKRERERTHQSAPRPSSPVATTLEQTAAREAQDREPSEDEEPELADNDGKRPVSPVAQALLSQTSSLLKDEGASDAKPRSGGDDGKQGSAIPNLLSSGRFPPAPHSPRHQFSPLASGSPGLASPQMPAAPPSTPYTPYAATGTSAGGANVPTLHPPLPLAGGLSTLPIRASSPPLLNNVPPSPLASPSATRPTVTTGDVRPPNVPPVSPGGTTLDPHYHALLNQALHETEQREKARVASLTEHERQNYTTIEEYQHALSRERRHSTSLAMELTHFQFLARYASCNVHSAAEINEEARINSLIKGIDAMKKDMNEDRCRVVMELEREEEKMINNLVMRLEEVEREKRLLERQISSVRGGGMMGGEEGRLHARLERMRVPSLAAAQSQHQQVAAAPQTSDVGVATADGGEKRGETKNTMEEGSEEEEEEGENENILEGRCHDPEMEKELADLLKMKESK
ncbi:hypothetical protein ACHAXT_012202 [Thalassiosira profunda]